MRAVTQQGMSKTTGQTVRDLAYLRQRFADAVMTERGELVGARDYGMRLDDLLDRNIDNDFAMRAFARVAEGIQHEPNGLADLKMQSFSLDVSADHAATVVIAGRWQRQDVTLRSPLMVAVSSAHIVYYDGTVYYDGAVYYGSRA